MGNLVAGWPRTEGHEVKRSCSSRCCCWNVSVHLFWTEVREWRPLAKIVLERRKETGCEKNEELCLHLLNYVLCKMPPLSLSKVSLLSERSLCPQGIAECSTFPSGNHLAQPGVQVTAGLGGGTEMTGELRTGGGWCRYAQFQHRRGLGRQVVNPQPTTGLLGSQAWSWRACWLLPSAETSQWLFLPHIWASNNYKE